ncbi:DUF3817 domain-containing protein [Cytophagaceae bacterium ABcell3]|nr:DUF3817 domain-containing protein [Cytophagaceae bacterium ABcell3]
MAEQNSNIKLLRYLRYVGIAEGISAIALFFIAMPLKYMADMPEAVKYTGWAHGLLFMAFMAMVAVVKMEMNKTFLWSFIAFLASIFPGGTFILDRQLLKEERKLIAELQNPATAPVS